MSVKNFQVKNLFLLVIFSILMIGGCAVKAEMNSESEKKSVKNNPANDKNEGAKIKIAPDSPAETVRVFYKNLREKKFREALFLTNLRPAIEGLTDTELKEFEVDFSSLAQQVPTDVEINGEIISGAKATVTANLPNNDNGKMELQKIELRKDNGVWIMLTVDESAEAQIKKEGKNYFFTLRLETRHENVKETLKKISEIQMVYALQNQGTYADLATLIEKNFVSPNLLSGDENGYRYEIKVSGNKKEYQAAAAPLEYGKNGKLSFIVVMNEKGGIRLEEKDKKGEMLKK